MIGFSPTGFGYDTYGRLLARHLGKYLPGNPTIVPQNRPGAGSLNLANYIFNAAPKDGTEIALVGRGVAMEPMLGGSASQAKFDSTKFAWIGSMNNEVSGFFIRQPGPVKTLRGDEGRAACRSARPASAATSTPLPRALNALLGTKLKPISGYPGTQEIMLAVERGELDGIVGYSWGVAKSGNKAHLEDGSLKIILQLALDKHKELPDIPLVTEFVKNPEDRQVLEMIFSRQSMGRPVVAPPGSIRASSRCCARRSPTPCAIRSSSPRATRSGSSSNSSAARRSRRWSSGSTGRRANVVKRAQAIFQAIDSRLSRSIPAAG